MTLQRIDAVGDQTESAGTGSCVLTGEAIQGFVPFLGNVTDGATVRYRRQNVNTDNPDLDNTEWEVTEGVYTEATQTLTRAATPYESSNNGALVDFSAGPQAVVVVMTAADFEVFSNVDGGNFSSNYGGTTGVDGGTF